MKKSNAPVLRPPGCGLTLDRANASYYGKRSRKSITYLTFFVEGEWLTYQQIADRIGIKNGTAQDRVRELKKAGQELTWRGLGLKDPTPA